MQHKIVETEDNDEEVSIALKLLLLVQHARAKEFLNPLLSFNRPQALTISATATTTSQHFCTT